MPRASIALPMAAALALGGGCAAATPSASTQTSATASASSSPTATATASASETYASDLYGYTLTLPSGWSAGTKATVAWDGVEAIAHAGDTVDQFVGPSGTLGWAYAAPTTKSLADWVVEEEAASARDHPCPASPETDEAITVDGEPAHLTGMHCPASGGILVLITYTIHQGVGFGFSFQDPTRGVTDETDRAAYRKFVDAIRFK